MKVFTIYWFKVRKMVGFDDFKCVPHYCATNNHRPTFVYQTKPPKHGGLVIGNLGKICWITKVSRTGDSRTPPCRNSTFKLLFEVGSRLSKDGNFKLGSSWASQNMVFGNSCKLGWNSKLGGSKASQFKGCVKSWPTKFYTS